MVPDPALSRRRAGRPGNEAPGPGPRGVPLALALLAALLLLGAGPAGAGLREDLAAARDLCARGAAGPARAALLEIVRAHGEENDAREAYYYLALLSRDGADYLRYLDLFLEHGGRRDRLGPAVQLRAGRFHYAIGDYRSALTRFEAAREMRGDATRREARYWIGLTLAALAERPDAERTLSGVVSDPLAGPLREPALFGLGEVRRAAGEYGAAVHAYAECLEAFPRGDYAPAAMLGQASAHELLGEEERAGSIYSRIMAAFPASAEAAAARQRLKAMRGGVAPPRSEKGAEAPGEPSEAPGTTAAEPAPPPGGAGGFSVQVGAFASEANALKLADDLTERGYPRVRLNRGAGGDRLFHVCFGDYPDHATAAKAGEEVSAALGLRYQIVPPPGNP